MVGATDLFFTILLFGIAALPIVFLISAVGTKIGNWLDRRGYKKSRTWLLEEFDRQSRETLSEIEDFKEFTQEHGLEPSKFDQELTAEIAHLRWSLEASRYFFQDLERFRKDGAPILLVLNDSDKRPRLLLGISATDKQIALSEGTVLPPDKFRPRLSEEEVECLRYSYPNLSGDTFSMVYSLYREDDETRFDQYSEEERRLS